MTQALAAIKEKISAQIVVHKDNYERIRHSIAKDVDLDIANTNEDFSPRKAVWDNGELIVSDVKVPNNVHHLRPVKEDNAVKLTNYERKKLLDSMIEAGHVRLMFDSAVETLDSYMDSVGVPVYKTPDVIELLEAFDAAFLLRKNSTSVDDDDVVGLVELVEEGDVSAKPAMETNNTRPTSKSPSWDGDPIEYFNEVVAELTDLGHEIDFDSRWGSSRKGFKPLVQGKRGEVSLKVSTTTDGSKIVIRTEYNDQNQITIAVMYERQGHLEISNRLGINVDLDIMEIIEFLSPATLNSSGAPSAV